MDNILYIDIETSSQQQKYWLEQFYLNNTLKPAQKKKLRSQINKCKDALSPHKGEIVQIGEISDEKFQSGSTQDFFNNFKKWNYKWVNQNIKFDFKFLFKNNPQDIPVPLWDTMIAERLLGGDKTDLGSLVKKYCGIELDKGLDVRIAPWHIYDKLQPEIQQRMDSYLKHDVIHLPTIFNRQYFHIRNDKLMEPMQLEMKLIPVLARMELNGITIDLGKFNQYHYNCDAKVAELHEELLGIIPFKTDKGLNSPKQLKEGLRKLGILVKSTNESDIKGKGPIADKLLEYRGWFKLLNTYCAGLIKNSNYNETGWYQSNFTLWGEYKQLGAETGRITSDLLQVFPKTREFREMFIPSSSDKKLISLDMSQIEPRIFGQYIGEGNFREFLKSNSDCYTALAFEMGMEADRKAIKAIILGIMYGKQSKAIARDLNVEVKQAKKWVDDFYKMFPEAKRWIEWVLLQPQVVLPSGRIIYNNVREGRRSNEGAIINRYIQGRAAELNKESLIQLDNVLLPHYPDIKILMTIHDEVLVESPLHLEKYTANLVKDSFQNTHERGLPDVPIHCEAHIISNWGESL